MAIVQYYKSQVKVGSYLYPIPPGGATLNWPLQHNIPFVAGNYWQINYIEGLQIPSIDATFALLDGVANNCPLLVATMNSHFMTRSNDYQHDVTAITNGVGFFDGYSGYTFPSAKGNSWSIGGAKGDDVRFSASYMMYDAVGYGSPSSGLPTLITSPLDGSYPYFQGQPIRFQSLCFQKGTSEAGKAAFDGVLSFNISYSNNMSADLSMKGLCPQSPLPIDVNAGQMTANATFTLQANSTQHIAQGDYIEVRVTQGAIDTIIKCRAGVVNSPNNRGVGTGRQTRTYNMTLVGLTNVANVAPIVIA